MILADIIGVIDRIALARPQPWPKQQTAWRDGTAHILMSPLEFIQRLAALVLQQQLALSSDRFIALNCVYRMAGVRRYGAVESR